MTTALLEIDIDEASQTTAKTLEKEIRSRNARVGIVGLGYVGLPLAVEFAKAGFR
jgi:molybdopterin/thiamine biosynthesis adenylyltransferase